MTLTRTTAHVGQPVAFIPSYAHKAPGVWTVDRLGPKNAVVKQAARSIRAPYEMLVDSDIAPAPATLTPALPRRYYTPGEVVTVNGRPGLHVVLADKVERVNVVKLGGDGGRYLRAWPEGLTLVPVSPTATLS